MSLIIAQVLGGLWLLRLLAARADADRISNAYAALAYGIAMIALPYPVLWLTFRIGWLLYSNFPALHEPSWDVGLAFTSFAALLVSGAVAVVLCAVAYVKLARPSRGMRATEQDVGLDRGSQWRH